MRAQAAFASALPAKARSINEVAGLDYTRVRYVQSSAGLRRHMRAARWTASTRNPELIILAPGHYEAKVDRLNGVDIIGATRNPDDVTLIWEGPEDTVNASGISQMLAWLTIRHTGQHTSYAINVDGPGAAAQIVLVGVRAYADDKGALGVGLEAGQGLWAYRSHFERTTRKKSPAAVLADNWANQSAPCTLVVEGCTATAVGYGQGFRFTDMGSGQADHLSWTGGTITGADEDVWIKQSSALTAIDRRSYSTSKIEAGHLTEAAPERPLPRRTPLLTTAP